MKGNAKFRQMKPLQDIQPLSRVKMSLRLCDTEVDGELDV